ncbi:hypothetical protein C7212DRAFT_347237 [Tuber magnatum]|uniref:GPI inositol-deacylase winged helix domain-containing protein n=1 Tax=Tuber magnatum TaxID=42249 RepID=A0A317SFI4_9PEZI|nr:hypothetical protein C7212DRAFT_347237 [Tuber magnatum]
MPLFPRSHSFFLKLSCSLVPQPPTRLPHSQNGIYWEINNGKKSHSTSASDVKLLWVAPVSEDTWYERLQQQRRELLQETNRQRVQELLSERQLKLEAKIKENSDLLHAVLEEKNHGLWLARNFNVCGALERIVFQATVLKMIRFNAILHQEVLQRGLAKSQAKTALKHIYHEVSKHAYGNDDLDCLCISLTNVIACSWMAVVGPGMAPTSEWCGAVMRWNLTFRNQASTWASDNQTHIPATFPGPKANINHYVFSSMANTSIQGHYGGNTGFGNTFGSANICGNITITQPASRDSPPTDAEILQYLYTDDGYKQKNATFALCAILHQLFGRRNKLCGYAHAAFKAKGKAFTEEGRPGGLGYLRDLLESSADHTFLCVALVLEILKESGGHSAGKLSLIVSTAPRNLAGLYGKMLDKSKNTETAQRILHILVGAMRPLSPREMNIAFRIRQNHTTIADIGDYSSGSETTVKDLCGLFVRITDSKVYLVHQTAREFLIKGPFPGKGNWQYTLCPMDSSFPLANVCITYLSLEEFENPLGSVTGCSYGVQVIGDYVQKYPLLDFAASHWVGHFRDLGKRQMQLLESTRLICKPGSKGLPTSIRVYCETRGQPDYLPFPKYFTHLIIASWFGQQSVVKRQLKEGNNNARSELYGTGLNVAADRKEKDIAKMLPTADHDFALSYRRYVNLGSQNGALAEREPVF